MGEDMGREEKWEELRGESSCALLVELQHVVRSSETKLQADSKLNSRKRRSSSEEKVEEKPEGEKC